MQPFPHPSDATHKIWSRLANWLQRYSSLKVWTTTDGRTDGRRRTDDGPLVYYKLTLWAFGSGELKTTEKRWSHRFPHYKSVGAFCCHGNQSFDPICPKTLCSLFPTIMMLHIKFDQDWPTGLRDIQVSSELWQKDGMTEGQGKSSIAPTFLKRVRPNLSSCRQQRLWSDWATVRIPGRCTSDGATVPGLPCLSGICLVFQSLLFSDINIISSTFAPPLSLPCPYLIPHPLLCLPVYLVFS